MSSETKFCPVLHWRSRLGPTLCPYENQLAVGRWFFYERYRRALRLSGPREQARVLDFGCWEGHFLPSLLANYAEVWALDNDSSSLVERVTEGWTTLQSARDLCSNEGSSTSRLRLVKADGQRLPLRSDCFDAVFCLDTLPFVPEKSRPLVIAELHRVLKSNGTAIFTLPIEIGPSLLVRELLRRASSFYTDGYRWSDLYRALFFSPRKKREPTGPMNLIGYDYRSDEALIESHFSIRKKVFLPWSGLRWLSPTVLLACDC